MKALVNNLARTAAIAGTKKVAYSLVIPMIPTILVIILVVVGGGCLLSIMNVAKEKLTPDISVDWTISSDGKKMIPSAYLSIYQRIGKKYGVPWNLLAAIHKVETSFGQDLNISSAGAVGHTQFMPCNWLGWDYYKTQCDRKGDFLPGVTIDLTNPKNFHGGQAVDENKDGKIDPNNVEDAIGATAKRFAADKKRTGKDWFEHGGAVWRYNPSQKYVDKVEKYFRLFANEQAPPISYQGSSGASLSAFIWPVKGKISSPFGRVRSYEIHKGLDIAAPLGVPMYAAADGVVTRAKDNPDGFGYYLVINHGTINGKQVETWYGHMYKNTVKVKVGDRIKKGTHIADVGNNGHSTGPHLHFEVHENGTAVNPMNWLPKQ